MKAMKINEYNRKVNENQGSSIKKQYKQSKINERQGKSIRINKTDNNTVGPPFNGFSKVFQIASYSFPLVFQLFSFLFQ